MTIEWVLVQDTWAKKTIGAVGFIGDEIAAITAFFDDKDLDESGKVSRKEKLFSFFSMKGRSVAKVASHAYANPDILIRDPSIGRWRGELLTKFARGLLVEGVYKVYFSNGISKLSGAFASSVTQDLIKSFVIKKTLEKTIQEAYKKSLNR